MNFLRKSLFRKLILDLFLFVLLIGSVSLYFFFNDIEFVPYYYLPILLGVFLVYFLLIYFFDVIRPLRMVLLQIQSLLAGKSYKQIFTSRIDEIGVLALFFNTVTKGFGSFSTQLKDRQRIKNELEIASELQRNILPVANPEISGLQIVAKNRPATELGGDSFNFFTVKDKTYIYIGDVTGHGVAAGLVMTMVNSLIAVFSELYDDPYKILVHVNRSIKQHVKRSMFMTLVMLSWDHVDEKMTFVGAGHEHILVYRAATGVCESILTGGIALGMVPDNSTLIKEQELVVEEGDFVVLYSDGIIEARNDNNELFGLDNLKNSVMEFAAQYGATGVNYHIAKDVSAFMGNHVQDDDMTLIVIKRTSKQEEIDRTTNWN